MGVESGGDPNAVNPNSSASGPGQFIDSTWLSIVNQHRPDLAAGKSRDEILALRNDPTPAGQALARDMTAAYAVDNSKVLTSAGLPATPGNVYLAHFAGPQGAVSVLKADPNTPAADVLGPAAAKANPFLSKMTVGDLQGWASRRMGQGGSLAPAAPPPGGAAAASAPMGLLDPNALAGASAAQGQPVASDAAPIQPPVPQGADTEAAPPPAPIAFRHLPMTAAMRSRLLASLTTR